MSYISEIGGLWFCLVCQSPLSCEEIDFECCDACDGEGIGDHEEDGLPPPAGCTNDLLGAGRG